MDLKIKAQGAYRFQGEGASEANKWVIQVHNVGTEIRLSFKADATSFPISRRSVAIRSSGNRNCWHGEDRSRRSIPKACENPDVQGIDRAEEVEAEPNGRRRKKDDRESLSSISRDSIKVPPVKSRCVEWKDPRAIGLAWARRELNLAGPGIGNWRKGVCVREALRQGSWNQREQRREREENILHVGI